MYFHTLNLYCRLKYEGFKEILNSCIKYCRANNKQFYLLNELKNKKKNKISRKFGIDLEKLKYNLFICEALCDKGITILFIKYINEKNNNFYFGIKIIFNPKKLLDENNNIDITSSEEIELFISKFNSEVEGISDKFPKFDDLLLSRIDYSFNYFFKNQQIAEGVMQLLIASCNTCDYDQFLIYDKKQKRKLHPRDSIYLWNKSMRINIYLKYNELINSEKSVHDIERAQGLIRFEVQCNVGKMYHIRKRYNIESMKARNFFREDIYNDIYTYYFRRLFGTGDIYKYNISKRKIKDDENISKKKKKDLLEFLELTNRKRSINAAKESYLLMGNTSEDFEKVLKYFDKLNINPFTIPQRYGIDVLMNPIKLILKK